ncbi:MAG: serpin family protein [Eubacteriales bacterium]|nr:serpin family protein [Eubacteriales bacterium]
MKEKKLFDAITNVREELIEEAKSAKLKKKSNVWYKLIAVAACGALVFGVGVLISEKKNIGEEGNDNLGITAILDVIYPKAYAFNDLNARREVASQNPVDNSIIEALNEFSYKTGSLVLTDDGKNINYSPVSLYYALSIAASGANSNTKAELLDLLGVSDTEILSKQCGNLYRLLYQDNKIGKLKIANSIWMDNDMNGDPVVFKNDFVKQVAENYYATSHRVDFAKKETGEAMADWISEHTNGTLSPTIETQHDQILSILNTVYFYDQWIDRFDKSKTDEDVFHLSDGNDVECDFMNQTFGSAAFTKGDDFTRAGLVLKSHNQMIFILPDEGVSPYDLLSSPERMKEAFEGGKGFNGEVVWKIPKFSFGSKLEVTDVLKSLGVKSAFSADADFSGITDHMAFITGINQETHIAIDEKGVEASAFTEIMYAGAAVPDGRAEMILDRPFIYGITLRGSLLFVGVCENPAK